MIPVNRELVRFWRHGLCPDRPRSFRLTYTGKKTTSGRNSGNALAVRVKKPPKYASRGLRSMWFGVLLRRLRNALGRAMPLIKPARSSFHRVVFLLARRLDPFVLRHGGQAFYFVHAESQSRGHPLTVIRVSLVKQGALAEPNALLGVFQVRNDVR